MVKLEKRKKQSRKQLDHQSLQAAKRPDLLIYDCTWEKNNLILIQGQFLRPKQKRFCFKRIRLVIPTISQDFNHGRQQRRPKSSITGTI